MKVLMAKKYGFCMGVKRAVEIVEKAAQENSSLTILHQIVHNPSVVLSLEKKGVQSVEGIENVRTKTIVFSAHGVSPQVRDEAKNKNLTVIDATCPLVLKVHGIVRSFALRGYEFIYVGHRGHPEPLGVMGWASGKVTLIEDKNEVELLNIQNPDKLVVVTQTTLSLLDTKETIDAIKIKYPKAKVFNTICFETTDRQEALLELIPQVDLVVVVGGKNSSNSQRLSEIARKKGKIGYLVEDVSEIEKDWFKNIHTVGLTSGASTPDFETEKVRQQIEKY
jgi:4-hydroxy-3-methylbut-2-en-1-yl diphosphate reductase